MLKDITLFHMIQKKVDWSHQRMSVLATNIANADTPYYRPKDLKKLGFEDLVAPFRPPLKAQRTSATHMVGTKPEINFRERTGSKRKHYEISPDGNAINVEDQLMKVNKTSSQYRMATALYQKNLQMLRKSLGGGK